MCGMCTVIKQFKMFRNTFLSESRKFYRLLFSCFQKFITLRLFIYRLFRIWYGFTVDEIWGLQLVSLPYPQTSESLTPVYHSSHILCIEEVYKLRVTFGVELSLKRCFFIYRISQSNSFFGMTGKYDIKDIDNFSFDMIFR